MLQRTSKTALAFSAGMVLMTASLASAQGHPAFEAETSPALGLTLQEGQAVYSGHVSLTGQDQAMVSITNESKVTSALHVVAIDGASFQHREHLIRLEPQGVSMLGLAKSRLDQLLVVSDAPFSLEVEGRTGKRAVDVQQRIYRSAAARQQDQDAALANKAITSARGEWQLSCLSPSSCTYVSPWYDGRVEDNDQIYWNLHTPISAYTTSNGSCSTIWYDFHPFGKYPKRALNCYGQTYRVTWRPYF